MVEKALKKERDRDREANLKRLFNYRELRGDGGKWGCGAKWVMG